MKWVLARWRCFKTDHDVLVFDRKLFMLKCPRCGHTTYSTARWKDHDTVFGLSDVEAAALSMSHKLGKLRLSRIFMFALLVSQPWAIAMNREQSLFQILNFVAVFMIVNTLFHNHHAIKAVKLCLEEHAKELQRERE